MAAVFPSDLAIRSLVLLKTKSSSLFFHRDNLSKENPPRDNYPEP